MVAETFIDRLFGLHRFSQPPAALIVPGNSVHGFGLRSPIWVTGIDEHGRGTSPTVLGPGRIVRFRGASAVVEMPEPPSCSGDHEAHVVRWHR